MRVLMTPNPLNLGNGVSGIHTLARKYAEHLPKYGIEFVDTDDFDLQVVHAGMTQHYSQEVPIVSHLHGLYWTLDYPAYNWQHKANSDVIEAMRRATIVTVPSPWVAETFQRDMHLNPIVIPHGIDAEEWIHDEPNGGYVLWNKNRDSDVCSPVPVRELAKRFTSQPFVSTFYPGGEEVPQNVNITGLKDHPVMRKIIQQSSVYLSTTKETFCIGALEAMASGKPILCFNEGNITELVKHGVNGYIASCFNYDDLAQGLIYCLENQEVLGNNGREMARMWTWENAASQVASVYEDAAGVYGRPRNVTVVIPCYNKVDTLERAVDSAFNQEFPPDEVIIVDNNSTDNSIRVAEELKAKYENLSVINEVRQGVAHARNKGIYSSRTRYICCLDADDEIRPDFLRVCTEALNDDPTLGLSYTRLTAVHPDGRTIESAWPGEWNYDGFLKRQNQVPTCCVFRRDIALRLGGYRQRYAPTGAGAEDAEFWLRFGSSGYRGKRVGDNPSFKYHLGGQVGSNPAYKEVDWLAWHPWVRDRIFPFASLATPSNGVSHEVPQYDKPEISVVIPVGPGHEEHLVNALDSLEAQTFRKWEAIVVLDNDPDYNIELLELAYPFVKWHRTPSMASGPGVARNIGAKYARGAYLLFLDCDDSLLFDALSVMYIEANDRSDTGIYSDYLAVSHVSEEELTRFQFHGRLISTDGDMATVVYTTPDYDCGIAQQQPEILSNNQFYIWNLISTLHPRSWWKEIGGFDESMPSWEDWDYWLRLARKGKCFFRTTVPLVVYRFHTGSRRFIANPDESGDEGRQLSGKLLEYLKSKRDGDEIMACGGCGGSRRARPLAVPSYTPQATPEGIQQMSADDIILVELQDGNIGDHLISAQGTSYNYRKHGDRFMMKRAHAAMFGTRIRIIEQEPPAPPNTPSEPTPTPEPPPAPVFYDPQPEPEPEPVIADEDKAPSIIPEDNLTKVYGVSKKRAATLNASGVRTFNGLSSMTAERLSATIGSSPSASAKILASAKSKL